MATGTKQSHRTGRRIMKYFVLEQYEAGIELAGTEVKSIRQGRVNLKTRTAPSKPRGLFLNAML